MCIPMFIISDTSVAVIYRVVLNDTDTEKDLKSVLAVIKNIG